MSKKKLERLQISERGVYQRINRLLQKENKQLRKNKTQWSSLGRYFIVDKAAGVSERNVDIEALARKLGTLKQWETIEPNKEAE